MKYVVCKEGVYMHDVFGPYDSDTDAIARADQLAAGDVDAHHRWTVRELSTDTGLGDDAIYTTKKPNCKHCGAEPDWSNWPYETPSICPCRVRANLEAVTR